MWDAIRDWFFGLGAAYGVDPLVFGTIYVGAIPFFTLAVAWTVRRLRRGESAVVPALAAGFCFVSAYLYLLLAGRNIPWWIYGVVAAMVAGGGCGTEGARSRMAGRLAWSSPHGSGSVTVNRLPALGPSLAADTSPPYASTTARTTASPRPLPVSA